MAGRGRGGGTGGSDCGFWLIVAAGGTETDSGLRVLGSGWAGSGCGDWVCGDFREFAGAGDAGGGGYALRLDFGVTWGYSFVLMLPIDSMR
jgi:hypothetical protein